MNQNEDPFASLEMQPAEVEPSQVDDPFASLEMRSDPSPETSTLAQKALALGKGALSGAVGAIPDTLTLPYNLMAQMYGALEQSHPELLQHARGLSPVIDTIGVMRKHIPQIPSVTELVEKKLEPSMGETSEDVKHLSEGAKFAGSLLGPGIVAKGASKLGKAAAEKALSAIGGTKATELLGAGIAGATMSKLQEEGYGLPASIAGSLTAGGLSQSILNGTKAITKDAIPKILSIGAKPSEKIINNAKKFGIELPSHVQLNSKLTAFLNNSYLKSIFSAKQYVDSIKEADQKMISNVVDRINSINPKALDKEIASKDFKEALKLETAETEKQANELYDAARERLRPDDSVKPSHTIKAINDLKSKLSAAVPSSDMKFMLKKLSDLSSAWGLAPKNLKNIEKDYPAEIYQKYLENLKLSAPELPLDQLIQQRSAFMRDIKYGEEAKGAKGFMNSLISAIDKDISTSKNHEFINSWRDANKFYKNEIADRIRSDFARSLSEGQIPKEAYSYMSSPQHVQELERMLGDQPAAKQVMNSLKRSKLQEVVMDKVTNADGSMSYANLSNLFNKKSSQQGMLKSLLGQENYKDLSELAEIAAAYSGAGKAYANPSGSALTKQDFNRIGGVFSNLLSAGTLGAISPYKISKVVSNPKYIDNAVKYAKARQHNDAKKAGMHLKAMRHIYLHNILPQIRSAEADLEQEE